MLVIAIQFLLLPHFHILPLPVLHICARKSSSDFSVELDLLPPFYILRSVWTRVNQFVHFENFLASYILFTLKMTAFTVFFLKTRYEKLFIY